MDQNFWYGLIFGVGFFVLGTVILVVILTQVGTFARARIARRDQAADQELLKRYEELAATSGQAQQATATDLAELRDRLDSIERLLREVP